MLLETIDTPKYELCQSILAKAFRDEPTDDWCFASLELISAAAVLEKSALPKRKSSRLYHFLPSAGLSCDWDY